MVRRRVARGLDSEQLVRCAYQWMGGAREALPRRSAAGGPEADPPARTRRAIGRASGDEHDSDRGWPVSVQPSAHLVPPGAPYPLVADSLRRRASVPLDARTRA